MRKHKMGSVKFSFLILSVALGSVAHAAEQTSSKYKPLPLPQNLRVSSSAPRAEIWEKLSAREKNLAYHLMQASSAGRNILFYQNHRHGLTMKALLEAAFSDDQIAATKTVLGDEGFKELLNYTARFEDMAGPYSSSNRKYILSMVTAAQLETLFQQLEDTQARDEIIKLMIDPNYEVIQYPEDAEGTDLENSGWNGYEKGITGAEMAAALKAGLQSNLNCRIVRDASALGGLKCQVLALNNLEIDGMVGLSLQMIVSELRLAIPYASSAHQLNQLQVLIKFLEQGNVEDFRQFNIEWVLDRAASTVDFMMGFVEVYQDYQNQIGSWESYVQIVDPKTTELSVNLAKNAQYFEDQMPYGTFKKKFPEDYSPPALMVYYFQEIASMRSAGYNLPNFDDIRRDTGAKNIIRLDLPGEDETGDALRIQRESFAEFLPASKVEKVVELREKIWRSVVLLHEIIGHGSGTYDEEKYGKKVDPVVALGALGSALEEQRADQTALVFSADPKLVKVGVYATQAEADLVRNTMYDWYMADFLRRTSKARTLTEAHQRGHWLMVKLLLESGAVAWTSKDEVSPQTPENAVLIVKDYQKYFEVARDLLAELQRIKATRDEAALKKLFAEHAPLDAINEPWAQAVIERGSHLAINSGSVEQPWDVRNDQSFHTLGNELTLESIARFWQQNSISVRDSYK